MREGMRAVTEQTCVDFANAWLEEHQQQFIAWRRHLHQHPELSHQETATTEFLASTLEAAGLQPRVLPCKGVSVDIGDPTLPLIAFRGDIDALPVAEESGLAFASVNPGVMHACGHDIHTAIVLALAVMLHAYCEQHGQDALGMRVRCIFQPAEEVMDGGAVDAIAAGVLQDVLHIFAVHCEPKLRTGQIGVRAGAITSAADVLDIYLHGRGGHTSRPHLTEDLPYAAGLLLTQLPMLASRRTAPGSGTVVAFGAVNGGQTFNAIPRTMHLQGTFRTQDVQAWRNGESMFREMISDIVAPTGAGVELEYTKGVPPVHNADVSTALLAQAVRAVDPHALVEAPQSSGGEDFSWYLEHVPGSMARLGCWNGEGDHRPDLHQADIVFDERALLVGLRLFASIVDQVRTGLTVTS